MSSHPHPKASVTVAIVNYRSGDDLATCLKGLLDAGGPLQRVVVVDNASGDRSWVPAELIAAQDQRVELRQLDRNVGLAAGVNSVLSSVDTRYLAVLNPDATPQPGWLTPLVTALETMPEVAVACPLILLESKDEINSAGQHLHRTGIGFNRLLHSRPLAAGEEIHSVGGLHGTAFLIRTEVLRALGGWDETGFLYHEDIALSWDLALMGHRIVCVPESRVLHDYHLTMYPEKLLLLERNRWALLLSHLEWSRLLALTPWLLLSEIMVWGLAVLRGPRFIAAKGRSYLWILKERARIGAWRRRVFSRPTRNLQALRRATSWSYPLSQLKVVGRERGESTRQPPGGLPLG